MVISNIWMKKKCNLYDFNRGIDIRTRRAVLSISEAVDLLQISHITVKKQANKQKPMSTLHFCVWKNLGW